MREIGSCKLFRTLLKSAVHLLYSLECNRTLGMESNEILDKQITASSEWDGNHAAHQGRLNFQEVAVNGRLWKAGSWSALVNDQHQWLQVELLKEESLVTSVATQGRNNEVYNQWITKYKLKYSNNGVNFEYYQDEGQNTAKVRQKLTRRYELERK